MKKKIGFMFEIIIGVTFIAFILVTFIVQGVAGDSEFAAWLKENVIDASNVEASFNSQLPVLIRSTLTIIAIYAVCKIVRLILHKQMKKSNRAKTIITLFDGFVKYGCAIAILIFVLKAFGVDTTALIASVGILTLVVGLGAQSLIADIIAGIFIIFENEFNAGEIVSIDDFRGTVIEVGFRSTKILDLAGNIKIINNSNISNVVNMSRELSLAIVDCEFPYDVDLEFIEKLIKDNLEKFKEKIPEVIEGPYYKGVSYYGESNVAIKLVAKCKEEDRYQVQRDLLREYRLLIVKNGIDIAYPQVVLNTPQVDKVKISNKDKSKVEKFVREQKVLSSKMDDQQD